MYSVLHELLMDKRGEVVFTCFSPYHLFWIAATLIVAGLLRKRKDVAEQILNLAVGLYALDFFLMPLAYGQIDIEKLPFHACTAMCVMCFLSRRSRLLGRFRGSFALLGFVSNLVYLIYPAGVMWHGVHPLCYRVIQTLGFHGLMTAACLLELHFGGTGKRWQHLAVTAAMTAWAVKTLATGVISIPGALITIIVTIVSSFYIAADYQTVAAFLKKLIPAAHRDKVVQLVDYAKTAVLAYIKSYSIMFCITFAELWLGFVILDIPYELALAFAIAFFDLMPILGVGGILMPWGTIALLMGNFKIGLGIWGLYLGITAVRNFVEPKLVGHQIGLHPLATLIAMVVGLKLAGLAGMLLLPISLVAVMRMRRSTPKQEVSNAQS